MEHSRTMKHRNLLFTALRDLVRHRLRSVVVVLCLTATLFPLVTAIAVSEGLRFQAEIAVREGAHVYVSEDLYGGNGPISLTYLDLLSPLTGISAASARVVGRTYFVDRLVAVVGLEKKGLLALKPLIKGDIPKARGEVIVGEGIVKSFGIKPGPGMRFTVAANNRKVFTPSATLEPSCLWGSDIMIMHLDDANEFFRLKGQATQLLLYATPGQEQTLIASVEEFKKRSPLKLEKRQKVDESLRSGYGHKGGIFIVLFAIGVALAIPTFLVTSGFGLREVHKEIGVLRATGWGNKEVLEKVALQNLLICLTATSLSVLFSMVWTKGFNGAFIAQFYIAEVGLVPDVDIPSRYLPCHAAFCLLFSLVVTLAGSLFAAWHKGRKPPSELMR